MDHELVFSIANSLPLPAWLLLAFAPRWKWTQRLVHSALMPLLLGVAYGLLFTAAGDNGDANFFSLKGVMAMFDNPQVTLAAWIHYLVFDLFVGAWQVRDARRVGINHLMVVPCLFFTLMVGPVGLVLYLVLRGLTKKRWTLLEGDTDAPSEAAAG